MEIINNLFHIDILDANDETIRGKVVFNRNSPIFLSHFPKNPIVPGVCVLYIIKQFLEKVVNKKTTLYQANNIKFKNVITPLYEPIFTIKITNLSNDQVSVKVNVEFNEIELAKTTLTYIFCS